METPKQKAIREAWLDLWETVKSHVDEMGWIDISIANRIPYTHRITLDKEMNKPMTGIFRPKSLRGLENNKGWFELPAKNMLPHGWYWIRVKHPVTLIEDMLTYHLKDGVGIIPFSFGTHYQPIEKPNPPIY